MMLLSLIITYFKVVKMNCQKIKYNPMIPKIKTKQGEDKSRKSNRSRFW